MKRLNALITGVLFTIVLLMGFVLLDHAPVYGAAEISAETDQYNSYWKTTIKGTFDIWSAPSETSGGIRSSYGSSASVGFHITKMYYNNTDKQYWYYGTASDGVSGYIHAETVNSSDLEFEDADKFKLSKSISNYAQGNAAAMSITVTCSSRVSVTYISATIYKEWWEGEIVWENESHSNTLSLSSAFLNSLSKEHYCYSVYVNTNNYYYDSHNHLCREKNGTYMLEFDVTEASDSTLTISPAKTTYTIKQGNACSIGGKITSNYNITKVTGKLDGKQYVSYNPNSKSVNIGDTSKLNSFLGASLSIGEHKLVITAKDSVKTVSKTITIVVKANTYTVRFNANGGTGAPANQTKTQGKDLTLSSVKPTRTGYTFQGWGRSTSGAVAYAAGSIYKKDENVTFYAIWKIKTYTVKFDANGGTGAPGSQTKTHGKDLTLSSVKPTRVGYTFRGWGRSTSGAVAYAAGSIYKKDENVTFYALWEAVETTSYTIEYNPNTGTGAPPSQIKKQGVDIILSNIRPSHADISARFPTGVTLDATGGTLDSGWSKLTVKKTISFAFFNWNTSFDGSGTAYAPGEVYRQDASVTLYAQWNETVTTESINLPTPTRSGYIFKGWGTSPSDTSGYEGTYTPSGNETLYAIWETEETVEAPVITSQPKDVTAADGETATFTIQATGLDLQYQWYIYHPDNDGVKIGEGASFTTTVNTTMDGLEFYCIVRNSAGYKQSVRVRLTVKKKAIEPEKELPFTDVSKSKPYYNALYWAYTEGIVKGKSETRFAPNDYLTRGEFCTMLWRMWGKQSVEGMTCPFADAQKTNHYKAILWCYNKGIINGYKVDGKQVFKPGKTITRGNILIMLFKLAKQEEGYRPASVSNPFTDVKDTNKNISAYKWAYENQVTTTTKLQTGADCKRWAMVSFLYGYNNAYHVKD